MSLAHIIKTYQEILIKLDAILIYTIIENMLEFQSRMIDIECKTPLIFVPWRRQTPLKSFDLHTFLDIGNIKVLIHIINNHNNNS